VPTSDLLRHEAFHSTWLDRNIRLTVYLPADSDVSGPSPQPRPCLILHDGQNLFEADRAHVPGRFWRVAETADALVSDGTIAPLVIVGVDHADEGRIREYTPTRGGEPGAGLAARHASFLVEELLPFMQDAYRVSANPAQLGLGGSSLGGLVTLYVASTRPGRFERLLVMSPSIWWDRKVILRQVRREPLPARSRVWLDIGAHEGTATVRDARRLRDVLRQQAEVRYVEDADGDHTEDSWARRFGDALQYLFPR
jgi:enterochelin esterase-like enzyme